MLENNAKHKDLHTKAIYYRQFKDTLCPSTVTPDGRRQVCFCAERVGTPSHGNCGTSQAFCLRLSVPAPGAL